MWWRDFSYLVRNISRMSNISISLRDTMIRINVLSLVPKPWNKWIRITNECTGEQKKKSNSCECHQGLTNPRLLQGLLSLFLLQCKAISSLGNVCSIILFNYYSGSRNKYIPILSNCIGLARYLVVSVHMHTYIIRGLRIFLPYKKSNYHNRSCYKVGDQTPVCCLCCN